VVISAQLEQTEGYQVDPLRISMVGLSRWESVFVQTTVDLASGIDIASWRLVNDPETADVLLVDADRGGSAAGNGHDDDDKPIVIAFSGDAATAGRGLTRPVSYADLIAVLRDIEIELEEAARELAVPEAPAISAAPAPALQAPTETRTEPAERKADPADALHSPATRTNESLGDKARQARRFVEDTRLIGLVKRIIDIGRPVEISHADYPTVLVFPGNHAYSTDAESLAIPKMFRISALEFQVRPISESAADAALTADQCRPLGWLVYSAALFGSEGRLLLHTDPDDRLKLTDWPDFDALPHLSEHRGIAKYMLVHTASLRNIAAATAVRVDKLIDFCNACEAAGLLCRESENRRGAERRDKLLDRMRGLFAD